MGLRDSIINSLDAVSNERLIEVLGDVDDKNRQLLTDVTADFDSRVSKAYEAGFYDGNDDPASGDIVAGGFGYKRISDNYLREGKIDYDLAIETAWSLWQKSPIAKRVLAMKRDHIIGHNTTPTSNDVKLLDILDEFWEANSLDQRASEFTMQLFAFGEQCFPAFVRESDGRVRLGYIDPASIVRVVKHPDNSLEDWAVIVEKRQGDGSYNATKKIAYRIIREDEDYVTDDAVETSENAGKLVTDQQAAIQPWEQKMLGGIDQSEYTGSCFYNKVNAVSNQSRGLSDLLQVGDWLEQADEVLFSLGDREGFAGYFSWDVTVDNADDKKIKERARELRNNPPEKGSVNVHNPAEVWKMNAPDLKQYGSVATFRALLGLILGGMGFPVHWFGFGDDANRATALAQSDPTVKSLEHDQGVVRNMFKTMCQFVADQAEIAGAYTPKDDTELTLDFPEVSTRDLSRITSSMQALVVSLVNAQDAGWISQETAATAFAKTLGEMDVQVDVAKELEQIDQDQADNELAIADRTNGQLQVALAQNGDESTDESPA